MTDPHDQLISLLQSYKLHSTYIKLYTTERDIKFQSCSVNDIDDTRLPISHAEQVKMNPS